MMDSEHERARHEGLQGGQGRTAEDVWRDGWIGCAILLGFIGGVFVGATLFFATQ